MKVFSLVIAMVLAVAVGNVAEAQRARPAGFHGERFEANKTFGLGLELGTSDGVNAKYFLSESRALDFGVGEVYDYDNYRGLHLYVDHLWHPVSLASTASFELPFYIGVGGSFWSWEDPRVMSGDALGVRVPIGIAFDFNDVPLDIFLQAVPTLDLFYNTPVGYDRAAYLVVEGSAGIRFWFK